MLKRTPLFAAHQRAGGKLIEFGGWEMPVQYSSIVDEHLCVRRAAGIFDICHMGEVLVTGPDAVTFLNRTLTNDAAKLAVGQGQYTLMCLETGGVVDDLYAYRLEETTFLLIINASRIDPDWAWLQARLAANSDLKVTLENASDKLGAVAIQGPRVVQFIEKVVSGPSQGGTQVASPLDLKKNQIGLWHFEGQPVWLGRTGYTGEDGYEAIVPAGIVDALWTKILAEGHVGCLQPCGLGARDTLRTEYCYPLYGHELDENTSPIEAGLGFFVALEKGDFCGRAALLAQKTEGVKKRCVAFKMVDKSAPPRPGYPIWVDGVQVGTVVSGTQSPSLSNGIGLGYVPPGAAEIGKRIEIEIRGKRFGAEIVKKPILRKPAAAT
ncbi:MAG TPA: glycine cleavage system aminomethyltransferase GcvT [Candidatus Limnocylindria bacterium]|nr:glycine cleavage system aminomethyltransferase GcvT [Candidatus Limnocylindria bacterium]